MSSSALLRHQAHTCTYTYIHASKAFIHIKVVSLKKKIFKSWIWALGGENCLKTRQSFLTVIAISRVILTGHKLPRSLVANPECICERVSE